MVRHPKGLDTNHSIFFAHCIDGWFLSLFSENIRSGAPQSADWWTEESASDSIEGRDGEGLETTAVTVSSASSESSDTRRFHNCGLETWLKAREEWKRQTVETLPPKPAPAGYNELVRGLIKNISQRSFELPRNMALSDVVDVYSDIWDVQCL